MVDILILCQQHHLVQLIAQLKVKIFGALLFSHAILTKWSSFVSLIFVAQKTFTKHHKINIAKTSFFNLLYNGFLHLCTSNNARASFPETFHMQFKKDVNVMEDICVSSNVY